MTSSQSASLTVSEAGSRCGGLKLCACAGETSSNAWEDGLGAGGCWGSPANGVDGSVLFSYRGGLAVKVQLFMMKSKERRR